MGVEGLGYATTITYFTMILMITINTSLISSIKECVFFPTLESFKEWGQYFRLAIPLVLLLCAEWWLFELMIILAGILGITEQAVVVICTNFYALLFMIPMGV